MLFNEMQTMADSILSKRMKGCCDGGWYSNDCTGSKFVCGNVGDFTCTGSFTCHQLFVCGQGGIRDFSCNPTVFTCLPTATFSDQSE